MPVLVADAVCDGDVRDLGHDLSGSGVHEVQGPLVVWLLEAIFGCELGEAPSVDSHHDPCVWEEIVGLLEMPDIFEPVARHGLTTSFSISDYGRFVLGVGHLGHVKLPFHP